MSAAELPAESAEMDSAAAPQFTGEPGPEETQAWEQIAAGRFMPRRIRGSYRGRALG